MEGYTEGFISQTTYAPSTYYTFDDIQLVPRYSDIQSRSSKEISTLTRFTRNYNIELPLIAAPMDTVCESDMACSMWAAGGVGIIHRFMSIADQVAEVRKVREYILDETPLMEASQPSLPRFENPVVCAAIGANGDSLERAAELIKAGVNVLLIDVAHGHHENVKQTLKDLHFLRAEHGRGRYIDIIAGNIATSEAAIELEAWGADALRVGIGGGSVCETRVRTGVGIPQFSCVEEIAEVATVPIISDGGIRYPGDVAKALSIGAHTVMIGSLFAGTKEAPGEIFVDGRWPNNRYFKVYRGSASATIKMEKQGGHVQHVEGASKMVELRGSVVEIVDDIDQGLRSAMSYLGAHSVSELQDNSEWVVITSAGLREAHPHLLL